MLSLPRKCTNGVKEGCDSLCAKIRTGTFRIRKKIHITVSILGKDVESLSITFGGCTTRFAKQRRIHLTSRFKALLLGISVLKRTRHYFGRVEMQEAYLTE